MKARRKGYFYVGASHSMDFHPKSDISTLGEKSVNEFNFKKKADILNLQNLNN